MNPTTTPAQVPAAPRELTLDEIAAVAGGPQIKNDDL